MPQTNTGKAILFAVTTVIIIAAGVAISCLLGSVVPVAIAVVGCAVAMTKPMVEIKLAELRFAKLKRQAHDHH